MSAETPADQKIPLTVLTGFLGSGKTTLLNRLLAGCAVADTAVIVNEFGETAIDHLLVEQADEGVIELSDGCLCCTVRSDLTDTLASLIDRLQTGRIRTLRRVVIETTGLADPAPVLQSLMGHPVMLQAFRISSVITTVDCLHGPDTLDRYGEIHRQIALADHVILTKTDMQQDETVKNMLRSRIAAINPGSEICEGCDASVSIRKLFETDTFNPSSRAEDVRRWLAAEAFDGHGHNGNKHHHHDRNRHKDSIRAFSLRHSKPVSLQAIQAFISFLQTVHGKKILRMKGIVATDAQHDPLFVIHGVQGLFYPPLRLKNCAGQMRETRLVIIADGLEAEEAGRLFDTFLNRPAIDTADRAAMTENPLAIPGLRLQTTT